jgi:hypothetical protein
MAYIGEWDGAAWNEPDGGMNNNVRAVKVGVDGIVYAAGFFTIAGGITVNYVAAWNGTSWSALDTGLDNSAYYMVIGDDNTVYVSGIFTQAGPLTIANRMARWNGFSWAYVDAIMPGAPTIRALFITDDNDFYIGFDTTGTAEVAGVATPTNTGSALSYPTIEIKNEGLLETIINETLDQELLFDLQILDGEIVTIDLNPGLKTITSNWRGNVLGELLPNSDLGIFKLESFPRANYGDTEGANLVSVFITSATPRESGDDNNQLSDWDDITGIAQTNTDVGWLYVNIVADGGGFFHVDLYKDSAKAAADLVGFTGTYNGAGAEAITESNDSGLGGTITVDAVVGADTDIEVVFTIATAYWFNIGFSF